MKRMKASLAVLITLLILLATVMAFGSANNSKKVYLCHFPPDHPEDAVAIYVSEDVVPIHLAHGDLLHSCCCGGVE
jgi:hypothetical protein